MLIGWFLVGPILPPCITPARGPSHGPLTDQKMEKYVCDVCGYVYDPAVGDPDNGIAPGTRFEDLPADWVCPLCSVDKTHFAKE